MSEPQLDLITLTVTPEESRMIATALSYRGTAFFLEGSLAYHEMKRLGWKYDDLRRKVEYQSGASDHHE